MTYALAHKEGDKNVKRFRVTVNGNQYDVVVEEIQGGQMLEERGCSRESCVRACKCRCPCSQLRHRPAGRGLR